MKKTFFLRPRRQYALHVTAPLVKISCILLEMLLLGFLMINGNVSCSGSTQPVITTDGPSTGAVSGNDAGDPSGTPTASGGASGNSAAGSGEHVNTGGTGGGLSTAGTSGSGGIAGSGGIVGTGGTNGNFGSGGMTGTGGLSGSGGSSGTGGAVSVGGTGGGTGSTSGMGGFSGASGSGGSSGSTGASGSGGSGGQAGSGGTSGTGGISGSGGSSGSVGTLISTTRLNTSIIGTGNVITTTLTPAGISRSLAIYVPSSRGSSPPLVIAFHGTNGLPHTFLQETGLQTLASTQGFILIAPEARDDLQGNPFNRDHFSRDEYGRWWQTYATDGSGMPVAGMPSPANNPDLLLVQSIIQEARLAYGIDARRVYVLGHSAGAFFSYLTAMALRDQVAAFAENAGGLINCTNRESCTFRRTFSSEVPTTCAVLASAPGYCACASTDWPIAVPTSGYVPPGYLAHGTDDNQVSVYYTCQLENRLQSRGIPVSSLILQNFVHDPLPGFITNAWNFMRGYTHP